VNAVGSKWNTAGTWEERQVHMDEEEFNTFLQKNPQEFEGYTITSASNVSGDVSEVCVRGKKKLGYELNMTVEVTKGNKALKVIFEEFTDYGEHEVS